MTTKPTEYNIFAFKESFVSAFLLSSILRGALYISSTFLVSSAEKIKLFCPCVKVYFLVDWQVVLQTVDQATAQGKVVC